MSSETKTMELASSVTTVELPAESAIARLYASTNLADAYSTALPAGATTNPEVLARFIFGRMAPWASGLMKIRDVIVAAFGLKTAAHLMRLDENARAQRVGIFKVYGVSEREIVLGEDDKHLDFRVSVLCLSGSAGERRLVLSTVVHCHNRLGRAYIHLIAPFHRLIVRSCLRRAARNGWPRADGAP